jgi:O-acetyl-ADP-ribose deacetylase (regulator of RNase III)
VIHAVGPAYDEWTPEEAEKLLAGCYKKSLEIAEENQLRSIAFPAISTGIFGYPKESAVRVVHRVVDEFKRTAKSVREIRFVLFSSEDLKIYKKEFPSK